MHFYVWDENTQEVYTAIKQYRRACDKFLKGNPSPQGARQLLEQARVNLVAALNDPKVVERLNTVISAGVDNTSKPGLPLDELAIDIELSLANTFGLKSKSISHLRNEITPGPGDCGNGIDSVESLIERVNLLHNLIVETTDKARQEESRQLKKTTKKLVRKAAISTMFGTGCTLANSYAIYITRMPEMVLSYAVALQCFHLAVRDIGDL